MPNYAYTRVSTEKQNEGLDNQLEFILDFVEKNNLNLSDIVTEVASAYYYEQTSINELLKLKNITIIVTDLSRLSRNVIKFKEYTQKMIHNNIRLISIKEEINNSLSNTNVFLKALKIVEHYQFQIKQMIEKTRNKVNNNWDFRSNRFGKKIIFKNKIRKLVDDNNEIKVIELIKALKRETNVNIINQFLKRVIPKINRLIELRNKKGELTRNLIENKLDYNTIANILNSYQIYNRGKKWNINSINKIIKMT